MVERASSTAESWEGLLTIGWLKSVEGEYLNGEPPTSDQPCALRLEVHLKCFYDFQIGSRMSASLDVLGRTLIDTFQVNNVCDFDLHNTKQLPLQFLLAKNLNGNDGRCFDLFRILESMRSEGTGSGGAHTSRLWFQIGPKVSFATLVLWTCSSSNVTTASGCKE